MDILFGLLLARSLLNNAFIVGFLTWSRLSKIRQLGIGPLQQRRLVIVLPVLDETAIIEKTVRYLRETIFGIENVDVIIVGSAQERASDGTNPTLHAARRAIGSASNFMVIESTHMPTSRARQLNFAISTISNTAADTWVLTLDIDSRYQQRGLFGFLNAVSAAAEVVHQPALFLENFSRLSVFQKGQALYQSRWTCAHECKKIIFHRWLGASVYHLVGHGLCIHLSALQKVKLFPESTVLEDVHLGYICSVIGLKVKMLPVFELADSPPSLIEGLYQQYRWASGVQQYPSFYRDFIQRFAPSQRIVHAKAFFFMLQGILSSVAWNVSTYLLIVAGVFAYRGHLSAAAFLASYLIEFLICCAFFRLSRLISTIDLILSPAFVCFELLKRSLPANWALIRSSLNLAHALRKAQHQ